jgi:predicted ATPase
LRNWRNFPDADLALRRRAFLIGANASGKSNLLDAVRFLRDVAVPGGGLAKAVAVRGGMSRIGCLAARRVSGVTLQAHIGTDNQPDMWRYELTVGGTKTAPPAVTHEVVYSGSERILNRPDEDDAKDAARLTQTHLEQVSANKEFREIAGFLATVRYLHVVPHLIREPERVRPTKDDPYGSDLLERIAGTTAKARDARLKKIEGVLQQAVPQLTKLELNRDAATGTPHLSGFYEHWRPNAGWQSESDFSDGTLRLIGLLWALLENGGPLLLEEPELSLHPDIVRHLPQWFARVTRAHDGQVLVSSHSTELLNDSGIQPAEVFVLLPGREGTRVEAPNTMEDVRVLVEAGIPLGEAALPKTAPPGVAQLRLPL